MPARIPVAVTEVAAPCVICGQAGDPAVTKDYRVDKLTVTVSFSEDGKAAGHVPVICHPCRVKTIKTAVSD